MDGAFDALRAGVVPADPPSIFLPSMIMRARAEHTANPRHAPSLPQCVQGGSTGGIHLHTPPASGWIPSKAGDSLVTGGALAGCIVRGKVLRETTAIQVDLNWRGAWMASVSNAPCPPPRPQPHASMLGFDRPALAVGDGCGAVSQSHIDEHRAI